MYQDDRKAIERFFVELRALDEKLAQRGWGECSNIHFNIELGHLRKTFWEVHPRAMRSIDFASVVLSDWTTLTMNQREAQDDLRRYEREALEQWEKSYQALNHERVAQLVLKAMASVEVPPIPAPSIESIKRARAAWGHQMDQPMTPPVGATSIRHDPGTGKIVYGYGTTPVLETELPPGSRVLDLTDGERAPGEAHPAAKELQLPPGVRIYQGVGDPRQKG
jgi:hypothetical protein